MTLKIALWATAIWTAVIVAASVLMIWYVFKHPIAGVSMEKRAEMLGSGTAVVACIGYAVIWLPIAHRVGKKRREEREAAKRVKKPGARKRPRAE